MIEHPGKQHRLVFNFNGLRQPRQLLEAEIREWRYNVKNPSDLQCRLLTCLVPARRVSLCSILQKSAKLSLAMINRNVLAWTAFATAAFSAAAVAAAFVAPPAQSAARPDPTLVRIASGALQGVQNDDVISFKGIPYAAPPVDTLRWRPPQPVKSWGDVRQTKEYGALCEQTYNAHDNGVGAMP